MRDFPGSSPDPQTLAIKAVFVPEGEAPPIEFVAVPHPLRFRATYDPETGKLSCENANSGAGPDIAAHWYPDKESDGDDDLFGTDQDGFPDDSGLESPSWARGLIQKAPGGVE